MNKVNLSQLTISNDQNESKRSMKGLVIILIVLGLVSCVVYQLWEEFRPRRQVQTIQPIQKMANTGSTTAMASFEAAGWVEPDPYAIYASALIEGWVTKIHVLEGESVKKGQLLAELDDRDFKWKHQKDLAKLETLKSQESYWQSKVKSDRELQKADAIDLLTLKQSESELAQMKAKIKEARLDVEFSKLNLDRCKIISPVDGAVLKRFAVPGQHLDDHNSKILSLYTPGKIQARVDVNLVDVEKVYMEQVCNIRVESVPDKIFKGQVLRFVKEADIRKNTIQVKVLLLETHEALLPDVLVRIRFMPKTISPGNTSRESSQLFIPQKTLQKENGKNYVFIVRRKSDHHIAQKTFVELGQTIEGELTAVLSGLNPTSKVIVSDVTGLKDGERIHNP